MEPNEREMSLAREAYGRAITAAKVAFKAESGGFTDGQRVIARALADYRAELRAELTAGDREAAAALHEKLYRIIILGHDGATEAAIAEIAAALSAARGERDAKWTSLAEELITAFEKMNNDFDEGIEITDKTYRRYAKARDALQSFIEEGPITKAARKFIYEGAEELDPKGYPAHIKELEDAAREAKQALLVARCQIGDRPNSQRIIQKAIDCLTAVGIAALAPEGVKE